MRSSLLLPLVDRCLETIDVCIWSMFAGFSVRYYVLSRRKLYVGMVVCKGGSL